MPTVELPLANFPEGSLVRVEQDGVNLVVIRSNERAYVYRDQCPHAFWPLSEGTLRKNVLECPGHGWEFDIVSGRCLNAADYCLSPVAASIAGESLILEWRDVELKVRACKH